MGVKDALAPKAEVLDSHLKAKISTSKRRIICCTKKNSKIISNLILVTKHRDSLFCNFRVQIYDAFYEDFICHKGKTVLR